MKVFFNVKFLTGNMTFTNPELLRKSFFAFLVNTKFQ